MSEEVNAVADVLAMLVNNSAKKGGARLKVRDYAIQSVIENLSEVRLAPQAIALVGLILGELVDEETEGTISESELFTLFDEAELGSKQSGWKVFQYYRKNIIEAGFLTEVI